MHIAKICRGALVAMAIIAPSAASAQRPEQSGPQANPAAADPLCSEAFRNDAALHDLCFVDAQTGWAVGDRGTIWATTDGGEHWQLQDSGVACPLYSVTFVDPQTGWAAGGAADPFVHTGSGVLLLTHDGGKTWVHDPRLQLPVLRKIHFFDPRHGWAVGFRSAMYPSGAFATDSGGRNWQPYPAGNSPGWLAAAFFDGRDGMLAGRDSALAVVQHGDLDRLPGAPFGLRSLHAVAAVPPQFGWLVGDGGLVAMTADRGLSWHNPPTLPPPELTEHFDWQALSVRGPMAWIAGSPGTRVLHSPDAGRTWTAFATGQPLPISALQMIDDQHGWAVAALGTILSTADGGRSWRRQRAGGTRAAVLAIFTEPAHVPLELLARLCGDEGYLGVVEIVGRRDIEVAPRSPLPLADRFREAVAAVGGSDARIAWRFPLRQSGLGLSRDQIVAGWDLANDGRGLATLAAELVRQIRQWRPEIVVTEPPRLGDDPAAQLVGQAVVEAVEQAADANAFRAQTAVAALEPWRVKKAFTLLPPGLHGAPDLPTAQTAPALGRALSDMADAGRALLFDRTGPVPATIGFREVAGVMIDDPGREDFFRGIVQPVGGDTRRRVAETPAESLDLLAKIAQRRRNVLAILAKSAADPLRARQLLAQADDLAGQLDRDGGAWLLYHLAEHYWTAGQWELAAESLQSVVRQYPQHPLRRAALTWLLQYYASAETNWRLHGRQPPGRIAATAVNPSQEVNRFALAAALGKQIELSDMALFAEPAIRFPLVAAYRNQGTVPIFVAGGQKNGTVPLDAPKQADHFYTQLNRSTNRDAWWACAQSECSLAERKGTPVKPMLHAPLAADHPKLDGRLNEPLWQQSPPAALHSPQGDDADWPAQIQLAYDHQFLYLAIVCRQAPHLRYEPGTGKRVRDADLTAHDRVDIFLDIDRSYATSYRLTVDHRGWTNDSCWGDRTWDPTWYVAARLADGSWTVEAAIPLDQLTGRPPTSGDVWAIGLQRIVPGLGFQSWSTPASTEGVPEGFGLLKFD